MCGAFYQYIAPHTSLFLLSPLSIIFSLKYLVFIPPRIFLCFLPLIPSHKKIYHLSHFLPRYTWTLFFSSIPPSSPLAPKFSSPGSISIPNTPLTCLGHVHSYTTQFSPSPASPFDIFQSQNGGNAQRVIDVERISRTETTSFPDFLHQHQAESTPYEEISPGRPFTPALAIASIPPGANRLSYGMETSYDVSQAMSNDSDSIYSSSPMFNLQSFTLPRPEDNLPLNLVIHSAQTMTEHLSSIHGFSTLTGQIHPSDKERLLGSKHVLMSAGSMHAHQHNAGNFCLPQNRQASMTSSVPKISPFPRNDSGLELGSDMDADVELFGEEHFPNRYLTIFVCLFV